MNRNTTNAVVKQAQASATLKTNWSRATFAGVTAGDPPGATFHFVLTLRGGKQKRLSQAVRVSDDSLLLRLLKLSPGTEIRVCTETDWTAEDIPTVLKDFCLV